MCVRDASSRNETNLCFFVSEPSGPSAESSTLRVHHLKIKPPNFPFAQKTTLDEKCELYASAAHSIIRLNKQITSLSHDLSGDI